MDKIKLQYKEFGYITNINIVMCFLNATKDGNKIKLYNPVLNKDKIDMKLYHHTYIWNDIKKEYYPEETDPSKIDFMINKISIVKSCDEKCKSNDCNDCKIFINLINHKNPITRKQKNVIVETHELIENKLIRKKLPEGKYETKATKSDFIISKNNGNEIKLNFEVENDINNLDVKTINFFFGDPLGKKNFIFYWNDEKKMYISKNNLCILIIAKVKNKFIMNSTIFNGLVKNYKNLEIKKSYERIKLNENGHYKIKFKHEEGFSIFLFKSEDKGFNLIFKNTPKGGGSKFFIWNSNKKMYTNDKYFLTFYKVENNSIYARLNKIDDKTLTLDNGKIHKSFESVFLEDGVYNVQNNISKTIVVTKGTFKSKISPDGELNTYYYNNVLKGYTTNDTASEKFIIILNEGNKFKLLRYHNFLTKEEPVYLVKSDPVVNYITLIMVFRIVLILITLLAIYLAYEKINKGYIYVQNDFLNLRFTI